jgi:hypothetical protein
MVEKFSHLISGEGRQALIFKVGRVATDAEMPSHRGWTQPVSAAEKGREKVSSVT